MERLEGEIELYFLPIVLSPKGQYNGQKLTRLVSTKTADSTIRIIPTVPIITFVKNKTATTTAIRILITLSTLPMFFFILISLIG